MRTTVVMRTGNEMPLIERVLFQINQQTAWIHLVAFDLGSTDGTRKLLEQNAEDVIDVREPRVPMGTLLNEGMRRAKSEVVVFLDADCAPTDELWLERLLMPFSDPKVAAAYGRLLRRPGTPANQWVRRNCFSISNGAVRRSVWEEIAFDEATLTTDEVAWSSRVQKAGHSVRYSPAAAVYQWQKGSHGLTILPQLLAGSAAEQPKITMPAAYLPALLRH